MRKEASRLLRFLRHFRILAEHLVKGNTHIQFTEEERRILDTVYDRAIGAEETTETSLETMPYSRAIGEPLRCCVCKVFAST